MPILQVIKLNIAHKKLSREKIILFQRFKNALMYTMFKFIQLIYQPVTKVIY